MKDRTILDYYAVIQMAQEGLNSVILETITELVNENALLRADLAEVTQQFEEYHTLATRLFEENAQLRDECARLRAIETAARAIEWQGDHNPDGATCPSCRGDKDYGGHKPGCALHAALSPGETGGRQ